MSNETIEFVEAQTSDYYDAILINGEQYTLRGDDTPEKLRQLSRHYALMAEYLESDDMKERQRIKTLRAAIAQRYSITYQRTDPTVRAMIEDILKLEEAAK